MDVTPGVYRRPLLRLRFSEQEYEGLVVRCRRPSLDHLLTIDRLSDLRQDMTPEDIDDIVAEVFGVLAELVVDWNLVDDEDSPVPTSAAGLRGQDVALIQRIVGALRRSSTGSPDPLGSPSAGGVREEDLPMAPATGAAAA